MFRASDVNSLTVCILGDIAAGEEEGEGTGEGTGAGADNFANGGRDFTRVVVGFAVL